MPAAEGGGICFILGGGQGNRSVGAKAVKVPASIRHIIPLPRRTALGMGANRIETVEHCLSACAGLGLDNLRIEATGPEMPAFDGSSLPFVEALRRAGISTQAAEKEPLVISEVIRVAEEGSELIALPPAPGKESSLEIHYDLDYGSHPAIGRQFLDFELSPERYREQIAPARTFILSTEIEALQSKGFGKHLSYRDLLVFGPEGPLDNATRFPDECVRHKILDLIGDLSLLGRPLAGRVFARKSGHSLNHELVRRILEAAEREATGAGDRESDADRKAPIGPQRAAVWDAQELHRLLPHRYPFLLVDRVLEFEKGQRIVAIKNVSLNEPFFQGHYPGDPIMPGVLIVEAMSQVSGLLLGDGSGERGGRTAALMSLDRVKFRQPVWPGDQLLLEAELVRSRAKVHHLRARARVGTTVVAEAEIRLVLVDAGERRQVFTA